MRPELRGILSRGSSSDVLCVDNLTHIGGLGDNKEFIQYRPPNRWLSLTHSIIESLGNRIESVSQAQPSEYQHANASNAALDESTLPLICSIDACGSRRQCASGNSSGPDMSVLGNTLWSKSAAFDAEWLNRVPTGRPSKTIISSQQSNAPDAASARPFFCTVYLTRSWSIW